MNVYTLYRKIPGLWEEDTQRKLIELWRESWQKAGWNPVVFGEEDLNALPHLQDIKNKIWRLPTMWGAEYNYACLTRWLLAANAGGGMLSDYDVINYGFRPPVSVPNKMTVFCADPPSCIAMGAVLGTVEHFSKVFDMFMALEFDPAHDVYDGKKHCSEFAWFARMFEYKNLPRPDWIIRRPGCVSFTAPGWRTAKLVHYGFEMHQVGLWPKYQHIPKLRN